jgi:FtsZ-binding cell division protein ZapB
MDRIDLLESKVSEMIGMVQRLHGENESLRAELAQANERATSLSDERQVLDQERNVVRDRIEQLLGDIESITTQPEMAEPGEPVIHAAAPAEAPPAAETAQAPRQTESSQPWSDTASDNTLPLRAMAGGRNEPAGEPEKTSQQDTTSAPVNPVLPGMS